MTLGEAAAHSRVLPDPVVPEWTMGCFRRRSITFSSGETDTETRVYWLQSGRLCADFRFGLPGHVEAGVAHATWDGSRMRWTEWTALVDRDKWPEAGELRRVGNSLIEFAPSGAYVEEWRLQPHEPGLLAGLRLIDETDRETGEIRHRGGGLLVCGQHIAIVRGGPDFSAAYGVLDPTGAVARILHYGDADPGWSLDGFSQCEEGLMQSLTVNGRPVRRRYTIDTLLPRFPFPLETPVSESGRGWLQAEADTLLVQAKPQH
jgi:hypothetical protein